jgi:hypothetical protein
MVICRYAIRCAPSVWWTVGAGSQPSKPVAGQGAVAYERAKRVEGSERTKGVIGPTPGTEDGERNADEACPDQMKPVSGAAAHITHMSVI